MRCYTCPNEIILGHTLILRDLDTSRLLERIVCDKCFDALHQQFAELIEEQHERLEAPCTSS